MRPWHLAQKEISKLRRTFYKCPLPKKIQRTSAPSQPNGPVRIYTREEIYLENLRRLAPVKGGGMQ